MHYLVSVLDDQTNSGTADEMAEIDAFNDRLRAEGHWVFAGGLASPSSATVIDNRNGEAMFTDGPYLESKEFMASFFVLDCENLDRALEVAAKYPTAKTTGVEVWPLMEAHSTDM